MPISAPSPNSPPSANWLDALCITMALSTSARKRFAAAGRGDGTWRLGSVEIEVVATEARRADGTLAGSVLTMDRAVRMLVELGVPETTALAAATVTPARLVGRPELGTLRPGTPADVVVLDDDLTVRRVLCEGQDAW